MKEVVSPEKAMPNSIQMRHSELIIDCLLFAVIIFSMRKDVVDRFARRVAFFTRLSLY